MSEKTTKRAEVAVSGGAIVPAPSTPGFETLFGLISFGEKKDQIKEKDKADVAFEKFLETHS